TEAQSGAGGLAWGKGPVKHGVAEIAQLLQGGFGGASVLVELREEEIEEGPGQQERIRDIAARVVIDGLLAPGVEAAGVERVGVCEEDLRGGNDHADGLALPVVSAGEANGPNGHGVVR